MNADENAGTKQASWIKWAPRLGLGGLALLGVAYLVAGEAFFLDRKMEALCKVDGGLKVYETVTLPASRFDVTDRVKTGEPKILGERFIVQSIGESYVIESSAEVIKAGNPFSGFIAEGRLLRHITKVRRLSDRKILGAEIAYGRTGGTLTLGHPSQNYCPNPRVPIGVLNAVFIKEV